MILRWIERRAERARNSRTNRQSLMFAIWFALVRGDLTRSREVLRQLTTEERAFVHRMCSILQDLTLESESMGPE